MYKVYGSKEPLKPNNECQELQLLCEFADEDVALEWAYDWQSGMYEETSKTYLFTVKSV
ncbi:hypothetical protein UFOVP111_137 [uncultured Caudovirales phage]|uniref:Uncharacterized protein n=1 Tax=uncultured Caudovirales phage TaxID=2100421 RepID=A0A6J5L2S3_9CAUD|nr:hypothetical protein UFOVP111_137 [uncultured Caudovirales phage]